MKIAVFTYCGHIRDYCGNYHIRPIIYYSSKIIGRNIKKELNSYEPFSPKQQSIIKEFCRNYSPNINYDSFYEELDTDILDYNEEASIRLSQKLGCDLITGMGDETIYRLNGNQKPVLFDFECKQIRRNRLFYDYFTVRINKKFGVTNFFSEEIIPCEYDSIKASFQDHRIIVIQNNCYGLFSIKGEEILPCKYENIWSVGPFTAIKENNEIRLGSLPYLFDWVKEKGGDIIVSGKYYNKDTGETQRGKLGVINYLGEIIIPWNKFDYIENVYTFSSLCSIRKDSWYKVGYIRYDGEKVYGLVDSSNKEIVPCVYKEIVPCVYKEITISLRCAFCLQQNNKYIYVNLDTNQHSLEYDYIDPQMECRVFRLVFRGEMIQNENGEFIPHIGHGVFGVIDKDGKEIVSCKYEHILNVIKRYDWHEKRYYFKECLADIVTLIPVKLNNKWGFVNTDGEIKIPIEYDEVDWYYGGLARVKLNNKWGFVNTDGEIKIPIEYVYASNFMYDELHREWNADASIINQRGKEVNLVLNREGKRWDRDYYYDCDYVCDDGILDYIAKDGIQEMFGDDPSAWWNID